MRGWTLVNRCVLWLIVSVVFGLFPLSYRVALLFFDDAPKLETLEFLLRDGLLFVFTFTIVSVTLFDFFEGREAQAHLQSGWTIVFVVIPMVLFFVAFAGYSRIVEHGHGREALPSSLILKQAVVAAVATLYAVMLKVRLWWRAEAREWTGNGS